MVTIASSPSPVGSGARAAAIGSAFIAIADDATAASWNPGGLFQMERPEISAVGAYSHRIEDFSDSPRAQGDISDSTNTASLNYLSAAFPFTLLNRNGVVSVNYQRLFDFDRNLHFRIVQDQPPFLALQQNLELEQRGSLNALSPALCVQITPGLSLGLAVNIWMDDIFSSKAWESHTETNGTGSVTVVPGGASTPFVLRSQRDERFSDLLGVNVTIGTLWNVWKGLHLGAVIKTPFRARADRRLTSILDIEDANNPGTPPPGIIPPAPVDFKERVKIDFPWMFGLGLSYRFTDAWTVSADVTRVEWSDFMISQTDPETGAQIKTSPFTGTRIDEADVSATNTVRAGFEYLFVAEHFVVPVRGGIFYDPLPAKGSPDDYYGFSLGSGIAWKAMALDFAYTFRYGDNVMGDLLSGVVGSKANVVNHRFLFSMIIYF